ncbi:MASE1 domain-containing protein [Methylopila sp. M107]|uniref:PAS domain S-box protein n=1 Tax=Methylopila sp. M107 TaxID=1101190 RepID=UPI00037CDCB8|nr:MASE1 domain-containing protein [Methylopila sp. M107]
MSLALTYFAAAALTVWLTRFSGGVASVWIASAILSSYLSLRPREEWLRALIACGVASAIATSLLGLGLTAAPFLAIINVTEALIGAVLLRGWIKSPGTFQSIKEVALFVFAVSIVAPLATAPFGAAVAATVADKPFLKNAFSWYAGHALGALTFGPLVLLVLRGEIAEWWRAADRFKVLEALALAAVMIAVSAAVFVQTTLPLLFLPLLPALIATFRLGRLGAAASAFILIAIGVPCSLAGWGPVALVDGSLGFRSQFFQFYVAIVLLTVLPAAAELHHRKRLFGALHDSESRYRLLAENTTDVIIWSELDTTRRYVSPAAKTLFGYEPEDLVGTKPLNFVHPDDQAAYSEILRGLAQREVEHAVTCQRYQRKDGAWIWVEVSFSLTFDSASGAANGYVASLRNVTKRRESEEALEHMAHHDAMTGLPNRARFSKRLNQVG